MPPVATPPVATMPPVPFTPPAPAPPVALLSEEDESSEQAPMHAAQRARKEQAATERGKTAEWCLLYIIVRALSVLTNGFNDYYSTIRHSTRRRDRHHSADRRTEPATDHDQAKWTMVGLFERAR